MKYDLFNIMLLEARLTKETFSLLTNTPVPTIEGWGTTRKNKTTPKWVEAYLKLYIVNMEHEIVIRNLKKDINNYGKN